MRKTNPEGTIHEGEIPLVMEKLIAMETEQ